MAVISSSDSSPRRSIVSGVIAFCILSLFMMMTTARAEISPRSECSANTFFDVLSWKCRSCPAGYTQYAGQYATCLCNGKFDGSTIGGFFCDTYGTPSLGKFVIQTSSSGVIQSASPSTISAPDYANGIWINRFTYKGIELNSQGNSETESPAVSKSYRNIPKLYASSLSYNYQVIDNTKGSVESQFLIFHLEHALHLLIKYGYHQKLANLCALTLLDQSDANKACSLYRSNFSKAKSSTISILKSAEDVSIFNSNCDSTKQVCAVVHGIRLPTKQTKLASTLKSYINLKLMTFDLDGNLIDKANLKGSISDLDNQLFLCPSSDLDGENLKEFGTTFALSCNINLRSFISDRSLTKYYQLLIETEKGTFAEVPVYNTAFSTVKYASRFVIIDNTSGFTASASSDAQTANTYLIPEKLPSFITIASMMVLNVKIQPGSNNIDMPILAITYSAYSLDSINANNKVDIQFRMDYAQEESSFSSTGWVIFIIGASFTGIVWLLKFNIWSKYNPQSLNLRAESFFFLWVVNGITILLNLWADFSYYFLFFMSAYWFVTYKLQENLYTLMANWRTDSSMFSAFQLMIILQYIFKKISFLKFLYRQLQSDVLFLDWENPKQYDEDSQEEEKRRGISVWRTLFMANEFNELSVTRVTNFEWTLFWVGFFLTGLKWDNLGQEVPFISVSDRNYVAMNDLLRYFIAAFVYIVIVLLQIIFKQLFIIWNPTPIQDFTDLCTIANISIFMLDDQLHGYYLHGKAPSGVAEGDTFWLKEAIEKESATGSYRGLVKGEMLQTFEMYIPIDMRFEFNTEFLQKHDQLSAMYNQNEWVFSKTVKKEMIYEMEKQKFHLHIMNLIKTYVKEIQLHSHNHVLDKSFFHRLVGLPPTDPLQIGLPFFFKDPGMSYSKIFYYGNEWFIVMFEMITFLFYNHFTKSPLASIMLTFLFNRIFGLLRDVFGRRNISSKTMIDQRFLI